MVEQVNAEDVTVNKRVISMEVQDAIISDLKVILKQINETDEKSESELSKLNVEENNNIHEHKIEDE